jgi:hypothetical protein
MRRSIRHAAETLDEVGQHCRAARLQELLFNVPSIAARAELCLENELDDHALKAIEALIETAREIARAARPFREVHNRRKAIAAQKEHAAEEASPPTGEEPKEAAV